MSRHNDYHKYDKGRQPVTKPTPKSAKKPKKPKKAHEYDIIKQSESRERLSWVISKEQAECR